MGNRRAPGPPPVPTGKARAIRSLDLSCDDPGDDARKSLVYPPNKLEQLSILLLRRVMRLVDDKLGGVAQDHI